MVTSVGANDGSASMSSLGPHSRRRERCFHKLAHRPAGAGTENKIARFRSLKREPKSPDHVARVAPIALGLQIAKAQFLLQPLLDGSDGFGDAPAEVIGGAQRGFVVVENTHGNKLAVFLPMQTRELIRPPV